MSLASWSSPSSKVTMWTLEPVISSVLIRGNTLDVASAKANFDSFIDVIEPLSMTTSNTAVVDNQIRGRWLGWLTWKQLQLKGTGNPSCVHCNMSGSSIMFMIRDRSGSTNNMMLTPESVRVLSAYSKTVCARMNMTSSLLAYGSTKLRIQPSLSSNRSTYLALYGNGSMQVVGSPIDIENLTACAFEILRVVMDTEIIPFIETMRTSSMSAGGF